MPPLEKTDAVPRVRGRVLGDSYRTPLGNGVRSNSQYPIELPIEALLDCSPAWFWLLAGHMRLAASTMTA